MKYNYFHNEQIITVLMNICHLPTTWWCYLLVGSWSSVIVPVSPTTVQLPATWWCYLFVGSWSSVIVTLSPTVVQWPATWYCYLFVGSWSSVIVVCYRLLHYSDQLLDHLFVCRELIFSYCDVIAYYSTVTSYLISVFVCRELIFSYCDVIAYYSTVTSYLISLFVCRELIFSYSDVIAYPCTQTRSVILLSRQRNMDFFSVVLISYKGGELKISKARLAMITRFLWNTATYKTKTQKRPKTKNSHSKGPSCPKLCTFLMRFLVVILS